MWGFELTVLKVFRSSSDFDVQLLEVDSRAVIVSSRGTCKLPKPKTQFFRICGVRVAWSLGFRVGV